jgi:hypothetical protein
MDIWQIVLVIYLVIGIGIAVTLFRLRGEYQPQRTELLASVIASFFSGILWGVVLPLIAVRLFLQRNKAA